MKLVRCLLAIVAFAVPIATAQQKLANQDVIKMVNAGIGAEIILQTIRAGEPGFDLSTDALVALKQEGVPDSLIQAMTMRTNSIANGAGGFTAMNGVILVDGTNRTAMKQAAVAAAANTRALGFGGMSLKNQLAGKRSDFRVKTVQPAFEVNLLQSLRPSEHVFLVKLDAKSDRREIEVGGSKFLGASTGFRKDDIIPIRISESGRKTLGGMQYNTYLFSPASPLRSGEYAINFQGNYYDFGVDIGK